MITREQAREIAEQFLRECGFQLGNTIAEVFSPEELEARKPDLAALSPVDERWRRCWQAIVAGGAGGVIYVSRLDGRIEFAGAIRGGPTEASG